MTTERNPWPALGALIVGYFMVVLDMTIIAVASPVITQRLHAGISEVVWASSAYLLVFAIFLLSAGRLGDRFGPRNIYLAGLALFTAASLLCGLSQTIGDLIAARALQGLGAALVTPQTMAVITRTFPPQRRSAAMASWGGVAGLANLVGPLLGGVLVDRLGWEWIFFVNVPVGVIGLVLAVRLLPVLPTHQHTFDLPGVAVSGLGMFLLVFGIQEGGAHHWDRWVWLMIAAGLTLLAVFVVNQARGSREPLLPLGLFRERNFALSNIAVASVGGAVPAVMVPLYFYLEEVRGLSGAHAGLVVAPMAILAMVVVPVIAKFGDRIHPRVIPTVGFTLFAVTLMVFAVLMTPASPIAVFLVGAAITGIANACIWPTLATTAAHSLPLHQAGAGAGAYNAIRQFGSVLGTAAISAVIANRMASHGLGANRISSSGGLTGTVSAAGRHAFGAALGESMYLPAALLVAGLAASAMFVRAGTPTAPAPRRRTSHGQLDESPDGQPTGDVAQKADAGAFES